MSNLINENNTLTTDAVPDAPRTNIKENNETEPESEPNDECSKEDAAETTNQTDQQQQKQKPSSGIPSHSTKPKKRAPSAPHKPTHANTKVINIVNSNGIHFGSINNYNLYSNVTKKKNDQTKQNILRTTEIDQFLLKEELVEREDIDYVSTHLGLSWRDVGIRLGYSEGQLDHFFADNKHIGTKEVVYQMLLDWTRMYPSNSKIGILSTALWDADQKDVVCRWMKKL